MDMGDWGGITGGWWDHPVNRPKLAFPYNHDYFCNVSLCVSILSKTTILTQHPFHHPSYQEQVSDKKNVKKYVYWPFYTSKLWLSHFCKEKKRFKRVKIKVQLRIFCCQNSEFITRKSCLCYSPVAPHKSDGVTFSPLLRYILPRFPLFISAELIIVHFSTV